MIAPGDVQSPFFDFFLIAQKKARQRKGSKMPLIKTEIEIFFSLIWLKIGMKMVIHEKIMGQKKFFRFFHF